MKQVLLILALVFSFYACSDSDKEACKVSTEAVVNPNGDSELALLMRKMYDDLLEVKTAIKEEKAHPAIDEYKTLLTATPTEERMKNEDYEAFALGFLNTLNQYKSSEEVMKVENFNNAIDACVTCHESTCHGPIRRINKLYLPKS